MAQNRLRRRFWWFCGFRFVRVLRRFSVELLVLLLPLTAQYVRSRLLLTAPKIFFLLFCKKIFFSGAVRSRQGAVAARRAAHNLHRCATAHRCSLASVCTHTLASEQARYSALIARLRAIKFSAGKFSRRAQRGEFLFFRAPQGL